MPLGQNRVPRQIIKRTRLFFPSPAISRGLSLCLCTLAGLSEQEQAEKEKGMVGEFDVDIN